MPPNINTLPSEQYLVRLAHTSHFPASVPEIIQTAKHEHSRPAVIQFLQYFSPYVRFENGVDFVNQCMELEFFMREVSEAPRELLRTP